MHTERRHLLQTQHVQLRPLHVHHCAPPSTLAARNYGTAKESSLMNKHQSHNTEEIPVCTCMVSSFTFFCSYSFHICMFTCIVGTAGHMVYGLVLWLPFYISLHICSHLKETVCVKTCTSSVVAKWMSAPACTSRSTTSVWPFWLA